MHMFMRPFHTICPSLPHKRQCILLHVEHRFPILCRVRASYIPIWYYIYDAWQGSQFSPSPLQHSTTNQSCPKVTPVTTGIIIHFSFSATASLYSSPCLHEICLYPAEWEYSYQVHTEPFSEWWCLEWVSNLWTFSPSRKLTRMCAHIHANLLILPPVLLSISVGSRVVWVDGCWQGLDCGGKDDGSSCGDRIAVSWDLLEGVIRLLWNLLPIRPSVKQGGEGIARCRAKYKCWVSLTSSYSILLSTPLPPSLMLPSL